jgi:very-short-patch-repair endonuclease
MRRKLVEHPVDGRIGGLAARQHGVISRAQLLAIGLGESGVDRRVRAGRLHRLHRGVYAVGHPRLTREGRFMAAVLACGPGAVLSHGSAAIHWGLPWRENKWTDVTVPTPGGRRRRRLVVVHRARIEPNERTTKDGIPVTSPSRTMIDLADYGRRRPVERALDEAAYLHLDVSALQPRQGRRGSGVVAELLARHDPGATRTRSDMEEIFLALCVEHGLPKPAVNADVEGYEGDFVWRRERLIIETDGHGAHGTRAAFEADRVRDAELVAAGWRVVRVTYRRLLTTPQAVATQLCRLL